MNLRGSKWESCKCSIGAGLLCGSGVGCVSTSPTCCWKTRVGTQTRTLHPQDSSSTRSGPGSQVHLSLPNRLVTTGQGICKRRSKHRGASSPPRKVINALDLAPCSLQSGKGALHWCWEFFATIPRALTQISVCGWARSALSPLTCSGVS